MNRIFIFFLLYLSVFQFADLSSQERYYYYKGKKQYLSLDQSCIKIITLPKSKTTIGREMIPQSKVHSKDKNTSEMIETFRFKTLPAESEYRRKYRSLKQDKGILSVQPSLLTTDQDTVALSPCFYVKLKEESDSVLLRQFARKMKVEIVEQNQFMPSWYVLECTRDTPEDAMTTANAFYESGQFANAIPGFMGAELYCCNDPDYSKQWGLNNVQYPGMDVNACAAWELSQGEGVKVAVFDSGIQLDHPDLCDNIFSLSYDADAGSSPSTVPETDYHGTHCAGIIGAIRNNGIQVAGIAPQCTLIPISYVFRQMTPEEDAKVANAINWAWMNGADVINNSWGRSAGARSDLIDEAIRNALTHGRNGKGTVVVFASGNEGRSRVSYPANSHPDILVVGAINKDGSRWVDSNTGDSLDLVAPGGDIFSTMLYSSPTYRSGTSMAAPYVSGVAALVLSRNPYLSGKEVGDMIERTAKKIREDSYTYYKIPEHPNGYWNGALGYGLVDAYAAVRNACTTVYFYEQNVTTDTIVRGCEIYSRHITVQPNAKLILDSREATTIPFLFEVKKGGKLELR